MSENEKTRYSDEELQERIRSAKSRLGSKLLILGHFYQRDEIICHADYVGDSFQLAKNATQCPDADHIVFCGVHFMAETADILSTPEQTVTLPNLSAGCSMADMANIDQVEEAWNQLGEICGTKPDADGNLIPAVAERWEISDDQLTYTFHLRPGVRFHDGSEVTAMDVAWSIDKAMQSGSWKALDNIDTIDIGSDYVSIVLKAADSDFLSYMTLAITPENHADGADPVGTGPVKYVPRRAAESCAGALHRLLGRGREGGQGHLSNL